ncbi:MAG: adenosylcobinamide-phosphate synthase CbiB [Methylomonas sp.]|jgi:adenosylcobinamide-phosphate synthase|uniref:adenosylcobinamide-phosphate synthase CbiB n=1 Tax=Methylomonas sp. TaxID=418 RepID=UPI0025FB77F9|nr:adenosylcobinamide-phosphate synthase CbiB [Methylomonas sp.]MCK9608880.1 adenosylcobinamide-phosphate synthase CbiB [Methylomonas sp.]
MTLTLTLLCAVALDYWLGEPRNAYHPLVAFGRWAAWLERVFRKPQYSPQGQKALGMMAWLCAMSPCLFFLLYLTLPPNQQTIFSIAVLYFCISARSLRQHAHAVHQALTADDLLAARLQVGKIVSRQTADMTMDDVRRATVESVLENGADAVFAPLFWFVLLGPFGALLYRFCNTLDAMWGYKTPRYRHFGWTAARFDDLLNWIPARLTALSYAAIGNSRQAIDAWQNQAHLLDSPNAGPVMTAGAGALNLQLGGPACYHGQLKQKPWFGGNQTPTDADIQLATGLIYHTLGLWLLLIGLGESLA